MKYRLFGMLLPVLLVLSVCLCGCDRVEDMGSLAEFSHPYAGEYVCEKLTLGGRDCLDRFESIKLTLKDGGRFTLVYETAAGNKGGYNGEYEMSPEGDEITFTAAKGSRTVARTFPVEKGAIHINMQFGTKLLHAEFCFPH